MKHQRLHGSRVNFIVISCNTSKQLYIILSVDECIMVSSTPSFHTPIISSFFRCVFFKDWLSNRLTCEQDMRREIFLFLTEKSPMCYHQQPKSPRKWRWYMLNQGRRHPLSDKPSALWSFLKNTLNIFIPSFFKEQRRQPLASCSSEGNAIPVQP